MSNTGSDDRKVDSIAEQSQLSRHALGSDVVRPSAVQRDRPCPPYLLGPTGYYRRGVSPAAELVQRLESRFMRPRGDAYAATYGDGPILVQKRHTWLGEVDFEGQPFETAVQQSLHILARNLRHLHGRSGFAGDLKAWPRRKRFPLKQIHIGCEMFRLRPEIRHFRFVRAQIFQLSDELFRNIVPEPANARPLYRPSQKKAGGSCLTRPRLVYRPKPHAPVMRKQRPDMKLHEFMSGRLLYYPSRQMHTSYLKQSPASGSITIHHTK